MVRPAPSPCTPRPMPRAPSSPEWRLPRRAASHGTGTPPRPLHPGWPRPLPGQRPGAARRRDRPAVARPGPPPRGHRSPSAAAPHAAATPRRTVGRSDSRPGHRAGAAPSVVAMESQNRPAARRPVNPAAAGGGGPSGPGLTGRKRRAHSIMAAADSGATGRRRRRRGSDPFPCPPRACRALGRACQPRAHAARLRTGRPGRAPCTSSPTAPRAWALGAQGRGDGSRCRRALSGCAPDHAVRARGRPGQRPGLSGDTRMGPLAT